MPPGFLWSEWLVVRVLGSGERSLRLIPYLAGVVSLLAFWRFCRRVTTRRTVLVAVAIFAASFYPVRHATEVKPYAIDLLISLALTYLGWLTWRDVRSERLWSALIGVAILGVWCSYTAVFPAAAVAVLLGARVVRERSVRPVFLWLLYGLSMGLSWLLMYLTFARPQADAADFLAGLNTWKNAFPPLDRPWLLPWWLIDIHTGLMMAYPYGGHDFGSVATTILVIAGSIRMGRHRARRPLLFLLLGPLAFAMVAAALHRYPYGTSTRVMLYMAPAFCLLAGEGIMAATGLWQQSRHGAFVVAGLLGLIPLVCMGSDIAMPYKMYEDVEHRRLAGRIAVGNRPGDEWVAFNGATPLPDLTDLMRMRWLQRVAVVRFYLSSYAPVSLRWQPDPDTVLPNPRGRTWLIVQNHGDADYFPEEMLAAYRLALEERLGPPRLTARFDLPN